MSIASKKRLRLAAAAQWRCYWCDQSTRQHMGWQNSATIEHLVPVSQGGTNFASNLASACYRCNIMRGTMCVAEFKTIAEKLDPDSLEVRTRVAKEVHARKQARREHLNQLCNQPKFTYLNIPDQELNSRERLRKDRTMVKQALAQSIHNPFEPGSRRHHIFTKELAKLPVRPAGRGIMNVLTMWITRVYSVFTSWENRRENRIR